MIHILNPWIRVHVLLARPSSPGLEHKSEWYFTFWKLMEQIFTDICRLDFFIVLVFRTVTKIDFNGGTVDSGGRGWGRFGQVNSELLPGRIRHLILYLLHIMNRHVTHSWLFLTFFSKSRNKKNGRKNKRKNWENSNEEVFVEK